MSCQKVKADQPGSSRTKTRTQVPGPEPAAIPRTAPEGAVSLETCFCKGDESIGGQEETPDLEQPQVAWVLAEDGRGETEEPLIFQLFLWKDLSREELGSFDERPAE